MAGEKYLVSTGDARFEVWVRGIQRKEAAMATGMSIHIGLNFVDPGHYGGWDGKLKGCENDARAMEAIAKKQKFATNLLLNEQATTEAVKTAIVGAATRLKNGDTLLLTYSGHGAKVPDLNDDERADQLDETWVLYDRQLIDDELYALWGRFENGVRILLLTDCCHSGTASVRLVSSSLFAGMSDMNPPEPRAMPYNVCQRTYQANQADYDQIQADNPQGDRVGIGASVIVISGCQDNQASLDGLQNGVFTGALLKTWSGGKFKGNIRTFHRSILNKIGFYQSPAYFKVGSSNSSFERQRPFTI